jgi:hypothetical protein
MQEIATSRDCGKHATRWTAEEIADLHRMQAEGCTENWIAAKLGRTCAAVRYKRTHLGLSCPNYGRRYGLVTPAATVVSRHFNVPVYAMRTDIRTHRLAWPRQLAMWLAIRTGLGYAHIGRFFYRDHTTVMHAERKVEALRESDPKVRELSDALLATLRENAPEPPPAPVPEEKPAVLTKRKRVASAPPGETDVCFYSDERRGRAFLEEQNRRFAEAMMGALG